MHVSLFGLAIVLGAVALVVTILMALLVRRKLKRDAARAGLDSISAYLKSPPRTDRKHEGVFSRRDLSSKNPPPFRVAQEPKGEKISVDLPEKTE
jgi:hypothetical protein